DGLSDSPVIGGWKSSRDFYVRIYAPKSERHTAKVKEAGKYTGFAVNVRDDISVNADCTVIEGIIFNLMDNGSQIILGKWNGGGRYCVFRNNIALNGRYRHLFLGDYQAASVYNNFFINDTARSGDYGAIDCGPSNARFFHRIYSNSFWFAGDFKGMDGHGTHEHLEIVNNLCYKKSGRNPCFARFDSAYFYNNLSSDSSALGSSSQRNKTLEDIQFASVPKDPDLRILPGSCAADAGKDLSSLFTADIGGQERKGIWDIGAHELSVIRMQVTDDGKIQQ
ncbi:MAG: hypothetical protein R2941_25560, partial [Desulfobacterales bacterium]